MNKGPTGKIALDVKNRLFVLTRLGFVYGAANYATAEQPNKVFGKYAVTSKIDVQPKETGDEPKMIGFANPEPKAIVNTSVQQAANAAQQKELLERGYMVTPQPGGMATIQYQRPNAEEFYEADFLKGLLTIRWQ